MHKRIIKDGKATNVCVCGFHAKSSHRIGVHVDKFNSKSELQDKGVASNGRLVKVAKVVEVD